MIDDVKPLTAKAKLALSRAELLAAMGYEHVHGELDQRPKVVELPSAADRLKLNVISTRLKQSLIGRWWSRHPLSSVVDLAEPFYKTLPRATPQSSSHTAPERARCSRSSSRGAFCPSQR